MVQSREHGFVKRCIWVEILVLLLPWTNYLNLSEPLVVILQGGRVISHEVLW